ncbi:MAG TPA: DUF2798 domain-containing protein [Syntrophomonas sp.]|nr:DUF2798 domain-containing protein [Syntrophomonas sp.]
MKMSKFDIILTLWISLIINIVLGVALPLAAIGFITWHIFRVGFAIAFPVSTIFVIVVPITKWGDNFAALFKLKPHTVPQQLVSTFIVALLFSLFMSALMMAINAGIGPHLFGAWLSVYPYAFISVYVSALVSIWTGIPLTMKILHIPKGPHPQPEQAPEPEQEKER